MTLQESQACEIDLPTNQSSGLPQRVQILNILTAILLATGLGVWMAQSAKIQALPTYTSMSGRVALAMGLIASLSTCLALTGGIVIGYANTATNTSKTQVLFHTGRMLAFILGGAILGAIGSMVTSLGHITWILNISVGVLLVYVGISLFGVVPSITRLGFVLPQWLSRPIYTLTHPRFAPIVGALTFLIPCGFTQTMQLVAVQASSPRTGARLMGMFALGTVPVLAGLAMGIGYIRKKAMLLNPLLALFIIAFGVMTGMLGYQAMRAWTVTSTVSGPESTQGGQQAQQVNVSHNGRQFEPYTITLKTGTPYRVTVTPAADGMGCMFSLVYKGNEYFIRQGEPFDLLVYEEKPTTIPLVCGSAGSKQGEIIVQ